MDEKRRVAAGSVAVALFLTALKLGVGLWTGSLGILSEAAHSGLDLLAALMTWFAVSVSGRPADEEHPYGHQKIENLSALFETLLLLLTCVWIIYEAVHRLFFKSVEIEVNAWSYLVVVVAMVMDFTRSRLLYRVAKKTHSAALEADALHFSSDIASSAVVLVGLFFTKMGYPEADPISALGVSIFVMFICYRLGMRSIDNLVDRISPSHLKRAAEAARSVPGVRRAYDIRVREAGDKHFVDLKVALDARSVFRRAHEITEQVEAALKKVFRNADILVHAEPAPAGPSNLWESAISIADGLDARVHHIESHLTKEGTALDVHLELPEETPFFEAHRKASLFEEGMKAAHPALKSVVTHLECEESTPTEKTDESSSSGELASRIRSTASRVEGVLACTGQRILSRDGRHWVAITCVLRPSLSLGEAHSIATQVEASVRQSDPSISSVTVHTEPERAE